MLKKLKTLFIFVIVAITAGCTTTPQRINWIIPTAEEFAAGDFGEYPKNYKEIINQWILDYQEIVNQSSPDVFIKMKLDSYWSMSSPGKHYSGIKNDPKRPLQYGYLVCAGIYGENEYGKKSDDQLYEFLIKNGRVVFWWMPSDVQRVFCKKNVPEFKFREYPKNYEKIVKNIFTTNPYRWKDPDSWVYKKITKPVEYHNFGEYVNNLGIFPTIFVYGHLVCVTVKDEYSGGGYVGQTTHGVLIANYGTIPLGKIGDSYIKHGVGYVDWPDSCPK